MIWLTAAKNVYTDSSLMGYLRFIPRCEKHPQTVDFAVPRENHVWVPDALSVHDAVGAERPLAGGALTRTAVAAALAELVAEGAFTKYRRSPGAPVPARQCRKTVRRNEMSTPANRSTWRG